MIDFLVGACMAMQPFPCEPATRRFDHFLHTPKCAVEVVPFIGETQRHYGWRISTHDCRPVRRGARRA